MLGMPAPRLNLSTPRLTTRARFNAGALPDARRSEASPLLRAAMAATDGAALIAGALACSGPARAALARTGAGALWDASVDALRGGRTSDAGDLSRAACLAARGDLALALALLGWVLPALTTDARTLRTFRAAYPDAFRAPSPVRSPSPRKRATVAPVARARAPEAAPVAPARDARGRFVKGRPGSVRDASGRFCRAA